MGRIRLLRAGLTSALVFAAISAAAQTVTYSTLVGSTAASNDGTGSGAVFTSAGMVLRDPGGDLVVLDGLKVRRVSPAAVVTTLPQTIAGATGLSNIGDFARDGAGNVYFVDPLAGNVKRIDPSGTVTTFYP